MASLSICGSAAQSRYLVSQPTHRPNLNLHSLPKLCQLSLVPVPLRWQMGWRQLVTLASNSNPSDVESSKEKSGAEKSDGGGQGPPFLTIVAGFLVIFIVLWVVGSIIMWLIGLIFNLASK